MHIYYLIDKYKKCIKISINAIQILTNQLFIYFILLKYKPDLVEPKCKKKRLGKHAIYNLLELLEKH